MLCCDAMQTSLTKPSLSLSRAVNWYAIHSHFVEVSGIWGCSKQLILTWWAAAALYLIIGGGRLPPACTSSSELVSLFIRISDGDVNHFSTLIFFINFARRQSTIWVVFVWIVICYCCCCLSVKSCCLHSTVPASHHYTRFKVCNFIGKLLRQGHHKASTPHPAYYRSRPPNTQ